MKRLIRNRAARADMALALLAATFGVLSPYLVLHLSWVTAVSPH